MKLNTYKAPFDMSSIPDDELLLAARNRREVLKVTQPPYFRLKKLSICKVCGSLHGAREMRARVCLRTFVAHMVKRNPRVSDAKIIAAMPGAYLCPGAYKKNGLSAAISRIRKGL